MSVLLSSNLQLGLMLATALSVSMWPAASEAYTPEQQQACTGDAMRLCSAYVPDMDRVTVCMIQKKSQLSPGCRAHFRPAPIVRGHLDQRRQTAQHQAGDRAKAGPRQATQAEK